VSDPVEPTSPIAEIADIAEIAAAAAGAERPLLVASDIDGTLSPIVARAADARLAPGGHDALARLAAIDGLIVAVVSGRPLHELRGQFGLDEGVRLIGSHGLEDSERAAAELDAGEQHRLDEVTEELRAVAGAVPGAWVEEKPAGAVLHVREASRPDGDAALTHAGVRLGERAGVYLIPGHRVLEVTVRPTSKAAALMRLRAETGARTVLFAGDDVADEEVMASLGPLDIGIRVGADPSLARFRVADPAAVVALLEELATLLAPA
jgi:trehalose 6-phosphate phosphatase